MGKGTTRATQERDRRAPDVEAAHTPQDHAPAQDPRSVLGNRSTRLLLVQPKLVVGASADPLEVEADRVAAHVVRAMAAAPASATDHECGDGCAVHGSGSAIGRDTDHQCGPGCAVHGSGLVIARATDHRCGPGCAVHGPARVVRRHAGHGHHGHHDGEPIGAGGGDVHAADEAAVKRARGGGGSELPAAFRSRVEPIMGADFSGVRVHTGTEATRLNRSFGASAFTVGNDIFFRDGLPDVSTSQGARLVSHELTHTIQQGGSADVARCTCGSTYPHVQRHSSFEHLMLGNVKPTDLATVGAWQDAIQQTKPTRSGLNKKLRGSGDGQKVAQVDVDMEDGSTLHIDKANILHVLLQEMLRLREWQKDEPKESSADQVNKEGQSLTKVGKDPRFDVVTVMLPQGILCTYGEMNTLGDYFGSVDVLRGAGKKQVWQLLQSVREETWNFLSNTFNKVSESLTKEERRDPAMKGIQDTLVDELLIPELEGDTTDFQGATAFTISGKLGQAELLTGIQGTGAQGDTNKYGTSLGRNACHFVPESWNAWAKNHNDARALATQSHQKFVESEQARNQMATAADDQARTQAEELFEERKAESSELANEALMANGFGDHFLQDSYAAGHMINKTQIMQFYIEYIDANDQWDYFKDANWRKVQNIAYNQTLAPPTQYDQSRIEGYNGATGANANKAIDPQSVENRTDGTWQKNFTELGLQVPRSLGNDPNSATRQLLHHMRALARDGKDSLKGTDIITLMGKLGFGAMEARMATADMVLDGVLLADVDVAKRGRQMASMRDKRSAADAQGGAAKATDGAGESLPLEEFRKGKFRLRPELKPKKGADPGTMSEAERQEMYQAITYNDYLEFIQSSFLQKSTNALHDVFCSGGLYVYDNNDVEIGKVYGDDAMFNANSSMGVAHSGTTSQMSRDSILNIINTGNDGGNTVKSIVDRFPRKVRADIYDSKGKVTSSKVGPMPIEAWHSDKGRGGLQGEANKWIFKSMDWSLLQKAGPGAMKDLGTFFSAPPPHVPF